MLKWDRDKIIAALLERQARGMPLNMFAIQKSGGGLTEGIKGHFGSHDAGLRAAGIDPAMIRKRSPWDAARVVKALRARRDAGLALNNGAVTREDPALSGAIRSRFGSHDAGLRAAGIDPASVRMKSSWDEARVLAALRARRDAGRGVNYEALQREDNPLCQAMTSWFGSHAAALRAAGIDPAAVRKTRLWDAEKVVAALRARHDAGMPLHMAGIEREDIGLVRAITSWFGSHDAGLRAAGLDPESIRLRSPEWDKGGVIDALRKRRSAGLAINAQALSDSGGLYAAAKNQFGSLDTALEAAGIDPATVRQALVWSKKRVVACLKQRRDAGQGVRPYIIRREFPRLDSAIRRHFDGYGAALKAAGIDPRSVGARFGWDRPRVLAELRRRRARRLPVNCKAMQDADSGLLHACASEFGSLDAALRAAGIDPAGVRRRAPNWTQDAIVRGLQRRRDRGLALNMKAIEDSEPGLYYAMGDHFGSTDEALRAAGIEPADVRKQASWSQEQVVARLRARRDKGLPLRIIDIIRSDLPLTGAIRRYFGSLDAALRAAGIDPATTRPNRPFPDKEAVLAALRAVARDGSISCSMVLAANKSLLSASRRQFGSFPAAVDAAGLNYFREAKDHAGSVGHWTKNTVLRTLCEMHAGGEDLRHTPMKTHRQSLFFAARKLFGSYVNAVREAGIDYWQMSQKQLEKERAAAGANSKSESRNPKEISNSKSK